MYRAQMRGDWHFPRSAQQLSGAVRQLTRQLLEPVPEQRLAPYDIWQHEWIQRCYIKNGGWRSNRSEKSRAQMAKQIQQQGQNAAFRRLWQWIK